jgi:hypothetical protein
VSPLLAKLFPEPIRVSLAPGAAHALRGEEKRAGETLEEVLAGWRGAVTVVASNRLVRYVVVPRQAGVSGEEEELALARHHFVRVYGEQARDWHVRCCPATGLASAVDVSVLDSVKAFFGKRRGLRLASFQPYLMAAFNLVRPRIPREGAWLVLPEPGATCIALYQRGAWAGVSIGRATSLERERLRMGSAEAPRTVLTAQAGDPYAMALAA